MIKKWLAIIVWSCVGFVSYAQVGSLDEMIERYPNDIELYFLRGQESLLNHQQFEQAIEDFDHVLIQDPDHLEARIYRSIAYFEIGEIEKSKSDALYARYNIKEDDARLNAILGIIFLEEGHYYRSVDFFTRQIQLDPNNPQGYNNRARALLMLPHYEQMALESYDQALEKDPHNLTALYNRVEPLLRLGHLEQAQQSITQAIHLEPTVAGFYLRRATVRLYLEDYERALADNYQVLRMIKDYEVELMITTLINIADIYLKLEQWQESLIYSNFVVSQSLGARDVAFVNQGLALLGLYRDSGEAEMFALAQEAFTFAIEAGFPSIIYLERTLREANPDYAPEIKLLGEVK